MGALSLSGTELLRKDATPLVAVSAMDGDRLVAAAVVDFEETDSVTLQRPLDAILVAPRVA